MALQTCSSNEIEKSIENDTNQSNFLETLEISTYIEIQRPGVSTIFKQSRPNVKAQFHGARDETDNRNA